MSNERAMVPAHRGGALQTGQEAREGFGERALTRSAETASTAVAAQARASVEARFVMALQRPRDWMLVRQRMLDACERPLFAKTAIYAKPIGGGKVSGPSIRFAEEAARCMTNLLVEAPVVFDDDEKQLVRVNVTDLEANVTFTEDVIITKTVERKNLKPGQTPLGSRENSYGDLVYLIEATDDDLLVKRNALKSKAIRNCVLRVLPSDIREEALGRCEDVRKSNKANDPEGAKKWLADNFRVLGITVEHLAEYLGHALTLATPDELDDLESIAMAIHDKETTWGEVMSKRRGDHADKPTPSKSQQDLKEKLSAAKSAPKQAPPARKPASENADAEPDFPPEPGSRG
jgi:hypothetical protein